MILLTSPPYYFNKGASPLLILYTPTSFPSQSFTRFGFPALSGSMVCPSASSFLAWAAAPPGNFSLSSPLDFMVRQ
jgi:hypothetical protein